MKNRHKVNDVYNKKIKDNEEKDRHSICIHSFDNVLNTYHNGTADMERSKKLVEVTEFQLSYFKF